MYEFFDGYDNAVDTLLDEMENYFSKNSWDRLWLDEKWDEGIARNRRRGIAAQRRLARGLARSRFQTQQEVSITKPSGRRGRLDVTPTGSKLAPFVYESKFFDLNARTYTNLTTGQLNIANITRQIAKHANQARTYQQAIRHNGNITCSVMPCRVRLIYQVPQNTTRDRYAQFANLARRIANQYGISVTVVLPQSRLSYAFEDM